MNIAAFKTQFNRYSIEAKKKAIRRMEVGGMKQYKGTEHAKPFNDLIAWCNATV